jgi:hypothetical protein
MLKKPVEYEINTSSEKFIEVCRHISPDFLLVISAGTRAELWWMNQK